MCTPGQWSANPSAIAAVFFGVAREEVVLELLEALPVGLDVAVFGLLGVLPDGIGDRPLDDHAHPSLARKREGQIDGLLVGDVERSLERVEGAAADGIAGGLVVAASSRCSAYSRARGRAGARR